MKLPARQEDILLRMGLLSGPLFLIALLVFGALTPGYSHAHKAVSELGALHTPWGLWFDLLGFLFPGLLAATAAWEFRRRLRQTDAGRLVRLSATGLVVSLLMMALTAVPADFDAMFKSPWTWVHAFFVLGSGPLLFSTIHGCARGLAALGVAKGGRRTFTVLGYLPIAEFFLYGVLPSTPGLVQRLMILTVHCAVASLCWPLLRPSSSTGQTAGDDQASRPAT